MAAKEMTKAQVAMEYLILVGFVLAVIIPLVIIFYNESENINLQVKTQQVYAIGQHIIDKAESVYYLGEPSKTRLKAHLPDSIDQIIIQNHTLLFKMRTKQGLSDVVISSKVNITGSIPKTVGLHFITIENKGNYVSINGT